MRLLIDPGRPIDPETLKQVQGGFVGSERLRRFKATTPVQGDFVGSGGLCRFRVISLAQEALLVRSKFIGHSWRYASILINQP